MLGCKKYLSRSAGVTIIFGKFLNPPPPPGADPEGGFGDLSPLNFLEVKII